MDKSIEDAILSVHRLVQSAVIRRLTEGAQSNYFDVVVRILSWGFPDTWSEDIGHQFQSWTKCDKCLPHVDHLVKQAKRYNVSPHEVQLYGELLLRCSWYASTAHTMILNLTLILTGICTNEKCMTWLRTWWT